MTQSKDDDSFIIGIDSLKLDDILDTTGDITINYDTMMSTSDTFTISEPADTVTIDLSNYADDNTFDIGNITFSNIPFVDTMPSLDRVTNMCEEYPALAKAYENFKTIYKMTEQDYKGKLKAKGLDDDIPF